MTDNNIQPLTQEEYSNFLNGLANFMFSNTPEPQRMENSLAIAQGEVHRIPVENVDEFIEAVKSCTTNLHCPLIISILRGGLILTEDYPIIGEMFLKLGEVIESRFRSQCLAIALELQKAISGNYPIEIKPEIDSEDSENQDSQVDYSDGEDSEKDMEYLKDRWLDSIL